MAGRGQHLRPTPTERLVNNCNIIRETGCWLWTKTTTKNGFPLIWIEGKGRRADRFAYNLSHGLYDYEVDSLVPIKTCGHNECCNPEHMLLVPKHAVNYQARKTHCKHGHEFTEANTMVSEGNRRCRTCYKQAIQNRRGKPRCKKPKTL